MRAFRRRPLQIFLTTLFAAAVLSPATGQAASLAANPYERGPAPTNTSIEAPQGPFATATVTVPASGARGFGGGTIYYPTSTSRGHVRRGGHLTGLHRDPVERRLARTAAGLAGLRGDHHRHPVPPRLPGQPRYPAAGRAGLPHRPPARSGPGSTPTRLGVDGPLDGRRRLASRPPRTRPALQAAIPLAGWHTTKNWSTVAVPTLVIGAESDTTAPVAQPLRAVLHQPAGHSRQGVPGAEQRQPLRADLAEHHGREVQHLLAQALHRRRHPLRAVPLPRPGCEHNRRGVPNDLPVLS